jgi:hypothetical protein
MQTADHQRTCHLSSWVEVLNYIYAMHIRHAYEGGYARSVPHTCVNVLNGVHAALTATQTPKPISLSMATLQGPALKTHRQPTHVLVLVPFFTDPD